MTCITGVTGGRVTTLAAESCASDGESIEERIETKAWYEGDWVIASMPSFRLMQILRYEMSFIEILGCPSSCTTQDVVINLIPELKTHVLAEPVPCTDFQVLMGGMGTLWQIDADFAVNEVDCYTAIGSGSEYAIGSMFTALRADPSARHTKGEFIAYEGVYAACQYSNACTPPIITRIS